MLRRPSRIQCAITVTVACAMALLLSQTGCQIVKSKADEIIHIDAKSGRSQAIKLNHLGMTLAGNERYALAIEKFRKAIATDQTYGPAHNNLGLVYFNRGNLYEAALAFDTASQWMPNNPLVMYNIGLVMESAGKLPEAIDYYGQAHETDPSNAMFLGNLVRARVRMGENDFSVREQLKQLAWIDTRKDWTDWADRLLALEMNPWLDRGPEDPDLSELNDEDSEEKKEPPKANLFQLAPGETLIEAEEIMPGEASVLPEATTNELDYYAPEPANRVAPGKIKAFVEEIAPPQND